MTMHREVLVIKSSKYGAVKESCHKAGSGRRMGEPKLGKEIPRGRKPAGTHGELCAVGS